MPSLNSILANGEALRRTYAGALDGATFVEGRILGGSSIDYTGATDSSAAIQTILNAASTAANAAGSWVTAKVFCLPGTLKITNLTLPDQVELYGDGTRLLAYTSGPLFTTAGSNWRLSNFELAGAGAAVGANGIVVPTGSGRFGMLDHLRFDQFSGRAIHLQSGSIGTSVTEVFAQNCLMTTAGLAAKTGVIEVAGTDHRLYGCVEVTASRSSLSSASAYACAVVVSGDTNFLDDVLAETSDIGFNLTGGSNILKGCRADLNRSHGFEITGGSGILSACYALNNGQETTNTYDGFNATAGNWTVVGCQAYSSVGTVHRYGFRDTQTNAVNQNVYVNPRSFSHGTAAVDVHATNGASVTPPANMVAGIPEVSGFYFGAQSATIGTSSPPQDYAIFSRIVIAEDLTLDRIGIEVTTGAASNVVRLGIYKGAHSQPTALVLDAGTIDASTTGFKEKTISQALTAGEYWLVAALQGGTGAAVRSGVTLNQSWAGHSTALTASQNGLSSLAEACSGALPATATPTAGGQAYTPRVLVRVV